MVSITEEEEDRRDKDSRDKSSSPRPAAKKGRGKKGSKERRERERKREREAEEEEDRSLRKKYGDSLSKSKAKVSRKRKRSEMESSSDSETALKTEVRRLMEKIKDMEGSRKWNSKSNKMQYLHQVKIRKLCVEDFRDALEEHFGDRKKIPVKLQSVVKKGEKEINTRSKALKMADRVSWAAVDKYQADPLFDGDEDDKKWKQAVKEAREEKDKRRNY